MYVTKFGTKKGHFREGGIPDMAKSNLIRSKPTQTLIDKTYYVVKKLWMKAGETILCPNFCFCVKNGNFRCF